MNELIQRLSEGNHAVTVGGSKPSLEDLKWRLEDIGYAFIKFTETQGGTDLGVRIDKNATNLSGADFGQRTGSVHIEGTLTLNYVKVRCIADIDLATLNGKGHLTILEEIHSV
ncbi:MAG: MbtH domain protein [Ktedonobacteraceae bacterium]